MSRREGADCRRTWRREAGRRRLCDDGSRGLSTLTHHVIRFAASGIEIGVAGLDCDEARRLADRWCAVLSERTEAVARPAFHVGERPLERRHGEIHEERFGAWKARLAPGGRATVTAIATIAENPGDRERAIDLCMTQALSLRGAVVVHGAAFAVGGRVVVAVGGSGSGKSTLTAAALRCGARVVSDDLVLVVRRGAGEVVIESLRRDLWFREAGAGALPVDLRRHLQPFDVDGVSRWRLASQDAAGSLIGALVPHRVWLLSIDRRLRNSRCSRADQATALAELIRGISGVFLGGRFRAERDNILAVLGGLVAKCPATRIRLGRDLVAEPAEAVSRLIASDGGD